MKGVGSMGKKKTNKKEYDYSELHYNGDIQKLMKKMAKNLKQYIDCVTQYTIIEGVTEEEFKKALKRAKKLIEKLNDGDPEVFDVDRFNEIVDSGNMYLLGITDNDN
jgi:hypothetical protein